MRRKLILGILAGAVVTIGVVLHFVNAGQNNNKFGMPENGKDTIDPLPITHVVLFNSGVGYIQREGKVTDNANVEMLFNTTDINDLLKSMILEDKGNGKINVISYDSSDPVDKILRSFALDLTSNPTFGQILNQARGEKIEATLKATNNTPQSIIKGTVIGMEVRADSDKGVGGVSIGVNVDILNLHSETGMKSIPLNQIEQVRFLNPVMEKEFQQALNVLAASHDMQKKRVTLGFKGAGQRNVKLGYVVEQPIWKMTYRLRMEGNDKLYLQGWGIVENTSDFDWNNINMVLVSGKPISFKMNLYEPLYIPRPLVEPDLFASLRPPLYDSTVNPGLPGGGQQPGQQQMPGMAGIGGFQIGGGFNIGGFQGGFQGGNYYQNPSNQMQQQQEQKKLTFDELQKRQEVLKQAKDKAKELGDKLVGLNFKEGIQSVATAEEIGDYFQYRLDQKVSLARKRSAMLPVFNTTIDGQKVSIYNRSVHKRFPLLGLRFKNTSGHPLTQGPISVFDENNYAGDTRILDVQPDEERLLSYAMDLSTKVFVNFKTVPSPDMTFKIGSDQLTARYNNRRTTKYTIQNDSKNDRVMILEHPIEPDWKLIEPDKSKSKTANHYRFEVSVPKGKTIHHEIVEDQSRIDPVSLVTVGKGPPLYAVLTGIEVKPETKTFPQELVDVKVNKGLLQVRHKERETRAYYVQNTSEQDRNFTIDHLIRPDWKLIDPKGTDHKGPEVYRFKLEVPKGKTGMQEVNEERIVLAPEKSVKDASVVTLQTYINSPVVSKEVKKALEKVIQLTEERDGLKTKLAKVQQELKDLSEDQARLRDNLKIIPPNAEAHKQFLEKFVKQELQIEGLQKQVREMQAALEKKTQEYETYVKTLTVN